MLFCLQQQLLLRDVQSLLSVLQPSVLTVSSCEVEKLGQFIKIKIFYDVNTFRFLTQANMKYVKAWLFIASGCWDWLNHIIVFVLLVLETPPLLVAHHETPAQEQHGQKWSKVNLRQVTGSVGFEGFGFF